MSPVRRTSLIYVPDVATWASENITRVQGLKRGRYVTQWNCISTSLRGSGRMFPVIRWPCNPFCTSTDVRWTQHSYTNKNTALFYQFFITTHRLNMFRTYTLLTRFVHIPVQSAMMNDAGAWLQILYRCEFKKESQPTCNYSCGLR